MQITKIANKKINSHKLLEELKHLGVGGCSFVGFLGDSNGIETPIATRSEYGHRSVNGKRTALMADPGELRLTADVDPGVSLDNALAAHDHTLLSTGQILSASIEDDKKLVQAELDSGRDLSPAALKAMASMQLFFKPIKR